MRDKNGCRRRHRRVKFVYPLTFNILTSNSGAGNYRGLFTKISSSGASFMMNNIYGQINPSLIMNSRITIDIDITHEDRVTLPAQVRWVTSINDSRDYSLLIGVEFEHLSDSQHDAINKIITLKDKDHKMMWTLWERYAKEAAV